MEEQNGDHERRTSEEDVGDLLLGVDEVLGNPAIPEEPSIPKRNGKGNEDEVHHVPAPKIKDDHLMTLCGQACHSGWKGNQFSFSGTPLDVSHTNGFPCQFKG